MTAEHEQIHKQNAEAFPHFDADKASVDGKPHVWIQWKGTDVCCDVRCVCGHGGHLDVEFMYFIRCAKCGRTYQVGQSMPLYELTPEQAANDQHRTTVKDFGGDTDDE